MVGIGGRNDIYTDREMLDEDAKSDTIIQVRPYNLRKVYRIREMEPSFIEKLITLRGIVIRCSDVVPEMKIASFICTKCHKEETKELEKGRIIEPTKCEMCGH